MSDANRRELERKVASGDVEAEAQLLQERVRSGDLGEEHLALAAYCDHAPSLFALGREREPRSVGDWLADLPDNREFLQRVAVAGGRCALEAWHRDHPAWPDEYREREAALTEAERIERAIYGPWNPVQPRIPRQDELDLAIDAACDLLCCPCDEHAERIHELVDNATSRGFAASASAFGAASAVAALFRDPQATRIHLFVQEIVGNACLAWTSPGALPLLDDMNVRQRHQLGRLLAESVPECSSVRETVCADLVPWALGYHDPVRERVQLRQEDPQ